MNKWIWTALMLCVASAASAEVVVVPATGYGDTFEQAVESALGNAVKQVNGATVATQSAGPKVYAQVKDDREVQASGKLDAKYAQETKDTGLIRNDSSEDKESLAAKASVQGTASSKTTMEAGVGSTTDVRSQGKVKSYTVTTQQCTPKGCTVELSVSIEKFEYQSKGPKLDRDSIAVVSIGRMRRSGMAQALRQSVSDKLVKGGRFTVLDRSNDAAFEKENDFLASDNVSDQQRARLGQAAGADFMLLIDLTQAGVSTHVTENYVDMTGESSREVSQSTQASLRYTLVDAATRAVKWSDSTSFSSGGNRISAAMDRFQDKIVGDIAEAVSPPKVIAVQNGRVIINRGEGIASNGQTYDIFSVGEALIDPDTGEKLGATEEKIATIKISEVKAKVAYGTLVSGQIEAIAKGSIARSAKPAPAAAAAARKAPARKGGSKKPDEDNNVGGVIL